MAPEHEEGKAKGSTIKSSGRPLEVGRGAPATRGGGAHDRRTPAVEQGPQGSSRGSLIMGRETSIASEGIVTVVMEQGPMSANGGMQVSGQAGKRAQNKGALEETDGSHTLKEASKCSDQESWSTLKVQYPSIDVQYLIWIRIDL